MPGPATQYTEATSSKSALSSSGGSFTNRQAAASREPAHAPILDAEGKPLVGRDLEDYCRIRGLCPLCAKTKTRKRVFKLFKKNKWEPITTKNPDGEFEVYRGYCVKPNCFTLDQAKRLAGEANKAARGGSTRGFPSGASKSGSKPEASGVALATEGAPSGPSGSAGAAMPRHRSRRLSHTNTSRENSPEGAIIVQAPPGRGGTNSLQATNGNKSTKSITNSVKKSSKSSAVSFPPAELKNLAFATTINSSKESSNDAKLPLLIVQKSTEALTQDMKVTILDLSNVKLRDIDLQSLAGALQENAILTSLILENCSMDDNGFEHIATGLCEAKDIPLAKLYLRTNALGDTSVDSLCQFLESNSTLEKLDLSRNSIGTAGGVAIFNSFHRNRVSRIRCLNLSHNEIVDLDEGNFGVRALLSKNRTLRVLNLEGNLIHDEGAQSLAKGIHTNDTTVLERLYLGWNGIGDDGTIALAKMLEENTSMRVLGLGENEIKNAGARALLTAMDFNTTVREISGLWRNQIDRRFIIVAIRRLLLSHDGTDNQRKALERRKSRSQSLRSIDQVQRESTKQLIEPQQQTQQYRPKQQLPSQQEENESDEVQEQAPPNRDVGAVNTVGGATTQFVTQVSSLGSELDQDLTEGSRLLDDIDEDPLNNMELNPQPYVHKARAQAPPPPPPPPPPEDVILAEVGLSKAAEPETMVESSTPFDRLTVFQSAPLAFFDRETSKHNPIPLYDYAFEADLIQDSLSKTIGAKIEVNFEPATIDGFSAFFREKRSRALHLSSFGHTEHVDFENGVGGLYPLPMESLKRLMSLVGGELQFVFVHSHHARAIGEAFVDAGIPHVVCCQRDERFRDPLSGEFLQAFYRALASNKGLKQAFTAALNAVRASPLAKNARRVLDRFCLLPESPNNQYYHNMPVFFAGPVPQRPPPNDPHLAGRTAHLPRMPQHFIGREVDMYEIIEALRADDIIRVGGSPGNGKDSVVSAVCHYMLQRQDAFSLDEIFWLPPPEGVVADEDTLYGDLCLAMRLMNADTKGVNWDDEENMECRERIELELEDMKCLIVIDDRGFKDRSQQELLEKFLSHLLNAGTGSKVLIVTSKGSDEFSTVSGMSMATGRTGTGEESTIEIGPLNFKSTALLFGGICKFITSSGCPAAHSAQEFAELLEPPCVADQVAGGNDKISERRFDLFKRMGNGYPSKVVTAATNVRKKQFIELIGIANRPEVRVDSLGQLELEMHRLSSQKQKAIRESNFLRATNLEVVLEELDEMREEFPSLEDLQNQEKIMKKELTNAVANRQYDAANELKKDMLALKKKIMKERRTIQGGQSSAAANGQIQDIKAHVESLINEPESIEVGSEADWTFKVNCSEERDCTFVITVGNLCEFTHESQAMGMVCWTNESCELHGYDAGEMMIKYGGPQLLEDIDQLPAIASSKWGPVRCGTGNAVIMGPENYGRLDAPCVILSVGPVSPSNRDDVDKEDHDTLHYVTSMMRSCYRSSLVLAKHAQLQTLGISMLTTKHTGYAYEQTLRVGLQTLVEEVKFSHLRDLHILTASQKESSTLQMIAREMGLTLS